MPKIMILLYTQKNNSNLCCFFSVMQSGIDSQNESQGPLTNNKLWIAIYFIVFIVIFSFFFINVFVGLIILTFQEQGASENGGELNRNAVRNVWKLFSSLYDIHSLYLFYTMCFTFKYIFEGQKTRYY